MANAMLFHILFKFNDNDFYNKKKQNFTVLSRSNTDIQCIINVNIGYKIRYYKGTNYFGPDVHDANDSQCKSQVNGRFFWRFRTRCQK